MAYIPCPFTLFHHLLGPCPSGPGDIGLALMIKEPELENNFCPDGARVNIMMNILT